jgi:cell division protein FtsI/penicillin-binding protein 2
MKEYSKSWRYPFVGALLAVLPLLIMVQMVRIQVDPEQVERLMAQSRYWSWERRVIEPARGQIYDRWGNLLAGNKSVYEIGVELQFVVNPKTIAEVVSDLLDVSYTEILGAASIPYEQDKAVYAVLADNVSQDEIDKLQRQIDRIGVAGATDKGEAPESLRGLTYQPHLARTYPENSLASNILGFMGGEGYGLFGVEAYFDKLLAGKPKVVAVPLDPIQVGDLPEVPDGASLVLTIDRAIQRSMEAVIDGAVEESGAQSGTLVVLDPRTGEIMALATTNRLNLNEYWRLDEIFNDETPFNRGVSQPYEPGSVFKVLTMASALDSEAVTPETVFVDTGMIEVGGTYIYNWNMGAWGPQDMQGCMQHSLNVCLAWTATQMGPNVFYDYLQRFGIGHLTGVDMAGEVPGRLKIPGDSDWYAAELGTNAFGQGVSVTPIQIAAAISALANDGKIMAPHIVRSVINEGYQHDIEQRVVSQPIRAETAHTITEMLARSLEVESSDALVEGYRVAGKTGTAEIPTPYGYTSNVTNASFVGWGPADDPQFLVYIWLEKPLTSPWGSVVASPVFRQAVEKLVLLIDLPSDDVRWQLNAE